MKTLSNTELASLMGFVLDEAQKVQTWSRNGDEYLPDFTLKIGHRFEQLEKILSVTAMSDEEFQREAKARGYVKTLAPTLSATAAISNSRAFLHRLGQRLPEDRNLSHTALINIVFETISDLFVNTKRLYLTVPQRRALEEAMQALTVENWTTKQKSPWPDKKNYLCLEAVLREAYDQAAVGKGAVRHADGKPFGQQPMQRINDRTGPGFTLGQALKKVEEAIDLPYENKVHELLGAINYIAGTIIWLRNNPPKAVDIEEEEEF